MPASSRSWSPTKRSQPSPRSHPAPAAGAGKGQLFTPEVGSQVLVGYEQGRAEFPVVLGNLFHARNPAGASYRHGPGGGEVRGQLQPRAGRGRGEGHPDAGG
ncbi:phage baseplate assembly protein V [Hymenobacter sp. H14-R3]|uniref:phage baseplate assembly protein V n=1 Tax=Hymenobacter sp. H14-R3 TaxID=3046308 RepID=UPI0024B8E1D6|nr:phage baseplate assembly protein V [Hymenobacter sp. H14-R3]MDJ0364710.1 phage baseplate assembly protein V [Hymenobacter sp. H14-R3]